MATASRASDEEVFTTESTETEGKIVWILDPETLLHPASAPSALFVVKNPALW
jgi:hypothetical protein